MMHVADIDGRIYDRRKREQRRQFVYAAWCVAFLLTVLVLVLFCGGGQ